jgi:hypothetical protein
MRTEKRCVEIRLGKQESLAAPYGLAASLELVVGDVDAGGGEALQGTLEALVFDQAFKVRKLATGSSQQLYVGAGWLGVDAAPGQHQESPRPRQQIVPHLPRDVIRGDRSPHEAWKIPSQADQLQEIARCAAGNVQSASQAFRWHSGPVPHRQRSETYRSAPIVVLATGKARD